MATYAFKAVDLAGIPQNGEIEGVDKKSVTSELKGKGLKPSVKQFSACTSPKKYKGLQPGKYKFEVRAVDAAGNADPTPDKDKFKVVDSPR